MREPQISLRMVRDKRFGLPDDVVQRRGHRVEVVQRRIDGAAAQLADPPVPAIKGQPFGFRHGELSVSLAVLPMLVFPQAVFAAVLLLQRPRDEFVSAPRARLFRPFRESPCPGFRHPLFGSSAISFHVVRVVGPKVL